MTSAALANHLPGAMALSTSYSAQQDYKACSGNRWTCDPAQLVNCPASYLCGSTRATSMEDEKKKTSSRDSSPTDSTPPALTGSTVFWSPTSPLTTPDSTGQQLRTFGNDDLRDQQPNIPFDPSRGPQISSIPLQGAGMLSQRPLPNELPENAPMKGKPNVESESQRKQSSATEANRQAQQAATPRHGRLPHSIIERRYRDNLNKQLETLRGKLPNLKDLHSCSGEIEESGIPAKFPTKAVIISAAIRYIEQLEADRDRSNSRVKTLQEQVDGLQKLVRCDDCAILKYLEGLQVSPPETNSINIQSGV